MAGLIGEDCACAISIGSRNILTGALTFGTGASVKGIAKTVRIEDKVEKVNTKAMGDGRKKFRASSGESTIHIDTIAQVTGWAFYNAATPVGQVVQVSVKENSAFTNNAKVWVGIVETWEVNMADGEVQMENITIACDADGI